MADPKIAGLKSSLLKAISDHLDTLEASNVAGAARAAGRDLYSRTDPGDLYSRTTSLTALEAASQPALK